MKYVIIDYYEDFIMGDVVDSTDNLNLAKRICREYDEDTDGECSLEILDTTTHEFVDFTY